MHTRSVKRSIRAWWCCHDLWVNRVKENMRFHFSALPLQRRHCLLSRLPSIRAVGRSWNISFSLKGNSSPRSPLQRRTKLWALSDSRSTWFWVSLQQPGRHHQHPPAPFSDLNTSPIHRYKSISQQVTVHRVNIKCRKCILKTFWICWSVSLFFYARLSNYALHQDY